MLHMIGNAHIDPVWLWRWPEGCAEAIGTCWAAIDRLEEHEGFVFTRGEAQIYAWIEAFDPALFARIRTFIAAGRWVVVNGWWVQPDCNIPSGEAFIRQALYGKRYFRERFGIEVPVGYNVDSFGHAATLPMLLRHTGSTAYVFMRPGPHEMEVPADFFDWRSPDGSTVPTFRIPIAYGTWAHNMSFDEKIDRHLEMSAKAGQPFMCFYGVGNHGGGPTRETIATIDRRKAAGDPLAFSDPNRFFSETVSLPRPTVATELQFHAIGCYAAASRLKQLNRLAEARLSQAETAATLAHRGGAPYPTAELTTLWQKLLFNQFHDTLGGTAIESACIDAERELGAVISGADAILNGGVRHLSASVRPGPDGRDATLFLANFNATDFDGLVEAQPWADFDSSSARQLLDEDGQPVPFQYVQPEGLTNGLQRILFWVAIPGFGYRLLRYAKDTAGLVPPSVAAPPTPLVGHVVETGGWRMEIDPATGAIARLVNRSSGLSVFTGAAHRGVIVDDPTDTWSHGIDRFGFDGEATRLERVITVEDGPLRRAVEIITSAGKSTLTTRVLLPADADLPVELQVRLDWREQRKLLRLAYPLAGSRFEYEIAAGWVERPDDGREVSGQRWVRAVRSDATVSLANDAKYSYAAKDGVLYITALRSPPFAHHDPVVLPEGASPRWMDQGEQQFSLRIGVGGTRRDAMRLADELLKPPVVTPHVARGGTAPARGQWLQVESASGAVIALKKAENGDDMVLRAIALDEVADRVAVDGAAFTVPARGIASVRLGPDGVRMSDGLED